MTELELEQAILDYIKILYSAEYIGYLKVIKLDPGYWLEIGVPSYMFPTTIAGDWATDEEFLNFVYEDLRIRNYMRVYFYKVVRIPMPEENSGHDEVCITPATSLIIIDEDLNSVPSDAMLGEDGLPLLSEDGNYILLE